MSFPYACFCESPARTHDALTKYTPFLLIKGSRQRLSPHFRNGSLSECFFESVFTQVTDTQGRLRHLHHMEVVLFQVVSDLQPNLMLSVVLECPSVGTSENN